MFHFNPVVSGLLSNIVKIALVCAVNHESCAQNVPKALTALEETRTRLVTSQIEWSRYEPARGGTTKFYTSRFANSDLIQENRGDEMGVVVRTSDGNPSPHRSGPQYILQTNGELWSHHSNSIEADLYSTQYNIAGPMDFRSLGATFGFAFTDIHDTLWKDPVDQPSPRKYHESTEDGLDVVSADTDYGTVTWWLDSQRDWIPVRVTLTKNGEVLSETRSTLKKFDDVWFPETVALFKKSYKDGKEPCDVIRIHGASFNRPEHPQRLTPNDIGVEIGTNVKRFDESLSMFKVLLWDGQKPIPIEEFNPRIGSGELQYGPSFLRESARLKELQARRQKTTPGQAETRRDSAEQPSGPVATAVRENGTRTFESEWEAYTRQFIERYKLDPGQTQAAWNILKDCQEQGRKYLAKRKADFDKLEQQVAALKDVSSQDRAERTRVVEQERAKLRKPLDDIFENQLKPKLDKLPTRAQRQAVEAASQSAGGAGSPEEKKKSGG